MVLFRLLVELWRVVLSDSHDDVAPRGGDFELRDELAGAVPQGYLPDKEKCAEDRRQMHCSYIMGMDCTSARAASSCPQILDYHK